MLPGRCSASNADFAAGDLDNDGRIDLLLVADNALALLHNQNPPHDQFLMLVLEGTTASRDIVGARVAVTAAGQTQVSMQFSGGGSFLSAS